MTNPPGEGDPTQPDQPHDPEPEQTQAGGQPGYQPGYWEQQAQQPPQPPYPPHPGGYPPPYPQAPIQYAPDHPRATTSLVLGILGVVLCQVLGPFAWVVGKRTLDEIDASQGQVGGRGAAQAGYVLGIVGTVMLGLALVVLLLYVIFAIAVIGGGIATS